jgi:hypothetical protein
MDYIATLLAGLWAGCSVYIAVAEHPSALKVGVGFATDYFRVMSRRTAPLMMILAGLSGAAALYIWFTAGGAGWLLGAVLMIGMFPFTGLLIVPTNLKLLKVDCEQSPDEALALHRNWGRMHLLRTLIGAPAFLIFLRELA